MGPTTSNHLQATVAEPSGLLAEEQTVKSGQGGSAVPKVIIPGSPYPCSGKHLANSPAVQVRRQLISDSAPSTLTTPDSFGFWSHPERAVDQSPIPISMHPAPGARYSSGSNQVSLTAERAEPGPRVQGDNEDSSHPQSTDSP